MKGGSHSYLLKECAQYQIRATITPCMWRQDVALLFYVTPNIHSRLAANNLVFGEDRAKHMFIKGVKSEG